MTANFGAGGYAFIFILYERIYRSGGELDLSDPEIYRSTWKKTLAPSRQAFDKMLRVALKLKIFDRDLWRSSRRLSSSGIKKRATVVTSARERMRKRREQTSERTPEHIPKGKESTEKESIEKESTALPEAATSDLYTGTDLEAILADRITWKKVRQLSRLDWDLILQLKKEHGDEKFFAAVDQLSGSIGIPSRYLKSVLEARRDKGRLDITRQDEGPFQIFLKERGLKHGEDWKADKAPDGGIIFVALKEDIDLQKLQSQYIRKTISHSPIGKVRA